MDLSVKKMTETFSHLHRLRERQKTQRLVAGQFPARRVADGTAVI
jgi:hypothetical protein